MTTIERVKSEIIRLLEDMVGREIELLRDQLTAPPSPTLGDFAFPCFPLAKVMGKSPREVADDISGILRHKLEDHPNRFIADVRNVGPYVNFFVQADVLAKELLREIESTSKRFGTAVAKRKQSIMVEYGQPNTHKEFHIGHLRNVLVGQVISNLIKAAGHRVIQVSYINDKGAAVAKCLWAMERFHRGQRPPAGNHSAYLGKIYAEAAQKLEKNPEGEAEVRSIARKIAAGDRKWVALWKKTREWSLADFRSVFNELGARFDVTYYESEIEKKGQRIVNDLVRRGIAKIKDGAVMVDLTSEKLDEFVLRRKDGTSLYSTTDLALAERKAKDYRLDESLIVVDVRQSFYFKQLFRTLELAGYKQPLRHLAYEFVTLPEGSMSSRKGNIVSYQDFRDEVIGRAREETVSRHRDWPARKLDATARALAMAAIRYEMLHYDLDRPIVFDISRAVSFEGATGPYLQYTLARVNGIMKKGKKKGRKGEEKGKKGGRAWETGEEKRLLLALARYPEVVASAAGDLRPSHLAQFLFELAKTFSEFYDSAPVLSAPPAVRVSRLRLVRAMGEVMGNGLALLGIPAVREM